MKLSYCVNLILLASALSMQAHAQDDFFIPGGSADPDFEGTAGAIILNGLQVRTVADLDFGVIAPNLTLPGTVRVLRGSNNNSICDPNLVCFENGSRARFTVGGEPGAIVTYENPGSILVSDDAGNTMVVDNFVGAGSGNNTVFGGSQRIRNSGIARFNVGATLNVNPNQPPGTYVGSFSILIEYQ